MASLQSEKVSEKISDVEIEQKMQESYIHTEPQEPKEEETIPDPKKEEEAAIKNTTEDRDYSKDANGGQKGEEAGPPPAIHESQSFSEKMKIKMGDNALIKKIEEIIHSHRADQEKSVKAEEDAPKQSLASKIKNLIEDNTFLQKIYGRYKGGAEKRKEEAEKDKEKERTDPAGHVKSLTMADKIKMKIGDNALIHKLEEIIGSHKDTVDKDGAEGADKPSLAMKVKNIIEDNAFIQKIYGHIKGGEKKQNGGEGVKSSEEKIDSHKEGETKHVEEEQKKSMSIPEKIRREVERNPLLQKIDGMINGPKDAKKKADGEKKGAEEVGVHKEEEKKNDAEYEKQAVPLS